MGRTIVADESIETQLGSLFNKDKWLIGIIIGQINEQKDHVLHLATTPKQELETGGSQGKPKKAESLETVSETWMVTHARQILRMLPGGLDIVGVFGMASPDDMKNAQTKLRQVLFSLYKSVNKSTGVTASQERVVLQICSLSKKLTCRTFDVSDPKSSARPTDWKYQRVPERWHKLETQMTVDLLIPVHNLNMSQSLEKQILTGLQPMCDNIWNSVVTIDHQMAASDELLDPSKPQGRKGKKQQDETPTGKTFSVQLFETMSAISPDKLSDPVITPCGAKLQLKGTMCCRAFVHSKATVEESIKALRRDIVRSLVSRCELLCEDLLQSEEEQDPKVVYETPLRVFAPIGDSTVQLCDYMFQDETNNDVVDRFKELIDLTVPEDLLETDFERIPDDADVQSEESDTECAGNTHGTTEKGNSSQLSIYLLGVIAVLLAMLITYLYSRDLQSDTGS